jgi:hypothetical protein
LAMVPVFAAGLAIQQLLEVMDPITSRLAAEKDKKLFLSILSLAAGAVLSFGCGLRILAPLGVMDSDFLDGVVTALITSAGTETFNSILKYLGYAKESKKVDVAAIKADVKRNYIASDILYKIDKRKL